MAVDQSLEQILEIIKFNLTKEQIEALRKELEDLYNQGGNDYSWNFSSKGID